MRVARSDTAPQAAVGWIENSSWLRRGDVGHHCPMQIDLATLPDDPAILQQMLRDVVELLGAELADGMQRAAAAAGARVVPAVDDDLIARQVRWQGAVVALQPCGPALLPLFLGLCGRLLGCLALGDALLQIIEAKLKLVGAQLFGPAAKPIA